MVKEFLRKYQDQLLEKRDILKNELNTTEIEIRKQEKFIEAISEDVAEPFSAFSPHAIDRSKQTQIDEQNEKMDQLQLQRTRLDQDIQKLDEEIVEVERSLQEITTTVSEPSLTEEPKSDPEPVKTNDLSQSVTKDNISTDQRHHSINYDTLHKEDIIRKIKNARDFLPADPMRARNILTSILDIEANL